jgi:hypothetical protein
MVGVSVGVLAGSMVGEAVSVSKTRAVQVGDGSRVAVALGVGD